MEFLVAAGALRREDSSSSRGQSLRSFSTCTRRRRTVSSSSRSDALQQLKDIVITNEMLEGW